MSTLCFALVALWGCPEEPPDMAAQLQGPGGGPSGQAPGGAPPPPTDGEGGQPSGEPGPPQEDGGAQPPADGAEGAAPAGAPAGELPSFELGDATITIRGTVQDADKGQVDFLVIEDDDGVQRPRVLHVAQLDGGAFEVTAPATWDDPIHVSTLVDETGDGPDPTDPEGGLEDPITLAGVDLTLELTLDHTPAWLEALHSSAALQADAEEAPEAAEPPPSEGAEAPEGADVPTDPAEVTE